MSETTAEMKTEVDQQRLVGLVKSAEKAYANQSAGFDFHLFDESNPPKTIEEALEIVRGEQTWHELHAVEVERCLDPFIRELTEMGWELEEANAAAQPPCNDEN